MTRRFIAALLSLLVAACGGGGGSGPNGTGVNCAPVISSTPQALTAAEVERVVAQAIQAAQTVGATGTIAVVDRVGNVLAVYRMNGARDDIDIVSGRQPDTTVRGLDNLNVAGGAPLAAIAKAITGAYLSSSGNAFSTRTASLIVQDHFYPGVSATTSGPLFGVQFSQLPCSDLAARYTPGNAGTGAFIGPKRSPLGLAADPGGLPIYKNGVVVGGIGIMADGDYGFDANTLDTDTDAEELIALAGIQGFAPPDDIRAERIFVDGTSLRFSDAAASQLPPLQTNFAAAPGSLVAVTGYTDGTLRAGTAYGSEASGYRAATAGEFANGNAFILTDGSGNARYPIRAPRPRADPPPAR